MVFIVRTEFQALQDLWHHAAVMALVGIPDHCAKCGSVAWTCGLRFLDQITQGLFADDWKDNIAHDAIRILQSRAGNFEQEVLLARDALQIVEQFTIDPVLARAPMWWMVSMSKSIRSSVSVRQCRCTKAASQVSLAASGCRRSS